MKILKMFRSSMTGLLLLAGIGGASAQSVSVSVLHQFTANKNDGSASYSEMIVGTDGVLYGTTWSGGTNAAGTVFRMNRDGSGFALIHHFTHGDDGAAPYDGVIQGADGFFYGTAYAGGTNEGGTIFKINTNGSIFSVLHRFTNSPDGFSPRAGLIQAQDGALYGTTEWGGSGPGTVFKIDTNGNNYAVLHSFTNFTDATHPFGRLIQASNGMLYGTTDSGGASFIGAVYQINTNGSNYAVIHSFNGSSDGYSPDAGLFVGQDGWLYGTTVSGGNANSGWGTVFKLNTNGTVFTVLRTFTNSPDGSGSYARLTQGNDGYLYGVTSVGGKTNTGTVFRLNTNGANYAVLYRFDGEGDGRVPRAGLFTTGNGVFYGTTLTGDPPVDDFGTIFRLAVVPRLNLDISSPSLPLLTLTGFANQSCQVQVSSNLIDWNFLSDATLTNGSTQVIDGTAANSPTRYYRAVIP